MTISSKKGTGKDIEVFDYFDDNIVGSQTKQVILLDRIYIWDNSGNYVENIQFEQYGNGGFVTTLPKLEAGQKYTITCVALVNKQLLSTSATTTLKLNKNTFHARSGKNKHSSYAEAEYRRNVIKKTSEKQEDGSYKYAMGEIDGDLRQFTKEMNAALNGRGGGKPFFVQGSVQATEAEIRNFFEK